MKKNYFCKHLPPEYIELFCEPLGGGASIGVAKPSAISVSFGRINTLNSLVVSSESCESFLSIATL